MQPQKKTNGESSQKTQAVVSKEENLKTTEKENQEVVHREKVISAAVYTEKKKMKIKRQRTKKILSPADLERVTEVEASYQKDSITEKAA
ncbi:rhomboid family intramembrane serine protease [Sesbania bispinosa]|nr:rhomboid family intramembrane serine protease [Sesbania bispinosa]